MPGLLKSDKDQSESLRTIFLGYQSPFLDDENMGLTCRQQFSRFFGILAFVTGLPFAGFGDPIPTDLQLSEENVSRNRILKLTEQTKSINLASHLFLTTDLTNEVPIKSVIKTLTAPISFQQTTLRSTRALGATLSTDTPSSKTDRILRCGT